jgi:hypothetical protein
MPDHLSDEDLDAVATMLIPTLEAIAAIEYPNTVQRGCRIRDCDRFGYARGLCYPHDKERRIWETT